MKPWPTEQPRERTPEEIARSQAARRSQAVGRRVEAVVERRLRQLGLCMVEKINVEKRRVGKRTLFVKKVSGDFKALLPGKGTATLVEVKHLEAPHLPHSAIKPHQREALDIYVRFGALALLVWARESDIRIMRWAEVRMHFAESGSSLSWESAADFAIVRPLVEWEWQPDGPNLPASPPASTAHP